MQESFNQLMQAYIKSYLESDQGQAAVKSAMKSTMISFINQHCIMRMNTFKEDATDPFSCVYRPYEQIEALLLQCGLVSNMLTQDEDRINRDDLAEVVLGISKSCDLLEFYVDEVKYGETPLTKKVDQLIQSNQRILIQIANKSIKLTTNEFLGVTDEPKRSTPPAGPRRMTMEEFLALEDEPEHYVPYSGPERAEASKLREHGYSVAQDSFMSDADRQALLKRLITSKVVSKGYVISYLKHMTQINGKKGSNYIALTKWKSDLEYVLKL